MTKHSDSLVSIVIITYNSSEYVLETLESAKHQTYRNIELIVSDDCSTDSTVAICREWLERNKSRFVRTELIEAEHNTGIPANCNRGYKKAQGEFIKGIAGDDILLPNCVEDLVGAIGDNYIITGICQAFYVDEGGKKVLKGKGPTKREYSIFNASPQLQHKRLQTVFFCSSPTLLIRKDVWEKVGHYNEQYPYIEDLPFLLKCTSLGFKIALTPKVVVLYRTKHDSMIQRKTDIYNIKFYECVLKFKQDCLFKEIPWYNIRFWIAEWTKYISYFIIVKIFKNKRNRLTLFIRKSFFLLTILPYPQEIKSYWYKVCKQKNNK